MPPSGTCYVYLYTAVDGFSRLAYTEHLPDEKAHTATAFMARAFFTAHGITRITRVVTDNYRCPHTAAGNQSPAQRLHAAVVNVVTGGG